MAGNTITENVHLSERVEALRLTRNHPLSENKIFTIVEGDSDEKFYRRFFDLSKVSFYQTHNCTLIVSILEKLKTERAFNKRIIGIKDADFDYILGKSYPGLTNLFLTDQHDYETTFISDSTIKNICSECLCDFESSISLPEIASHIKTLSILRLYNEKEIVQQNLKGICFKNISLSNIYDGETAIEINNCIDYIKAVNNNARLEYFPSEEDLLRFSTNYRNVEWKKLTQGHDLIGALVQRIINKLGHSTKVGKEQCCQILRATCTFEQFKSSKLYENINSWMENNDINFWKAS